MKSLSASLNTISEWAAPEPPKRRCATCPAFLRRTNPLDYCSTCQQRNERQELLELRRAICKLTGAQARVVKELTRKELEQLERCPSDVERRILLGLRK